MLMIADGDDRAFRDESAYLCLAKATGAAGDESNLACESIRHVTLVPGARCVRADRASRGASSPDRDAGSFRR